MGQQLSLDSPWGAGVVLTANNADADDQIHSWNQKQ